MRPVVLRPVESLVAARSHRRNVPAPIAQANTVWRSPPHCMSLRRSIRLAAQVAVGYGLSGEKEHSMQPPLKSIELMLATNSPPFSRKGWIFELKYDGYRILASKTQLMTRNHKDATKWYPEILAALKKLQGDLIMDGEACLLDEKGIPHFEGMRGRPDKHPEPITSRSTCYS